MVYLWVRVRLSVYLRVYIDCVLCVGLRAHVHVRVRLCACGARGWLALDVDVRPAPNGASTRSTCGMRRV